MKKIEDGGPVFSHMAADGHPDYRLGLTLRDWFAGQALVEFVRINERVTTGRENIPYDLVLKVTAEQAYALADAMIAARKEPHAHTNPN